MPQPFQYAKRHYSSWDTPYQDFVDWLNDRLQEGLTYVDSVQTFNPDGTMSTRICIFKATP